MTRLINPATGTVVHVQGELESRYRSRGWGEPNGKPEAMKAAPERPSEDEGSDKPVTRSNTRRKK